MSEQKQQADKVDEERDNVPEPESSQIADESGKMNSTATNENAPDSKVDVDGVQSERREAEEVGTADVQSRREKPSPLTLPKDLLGPHEADTLHAPESPTTSLISSLRTQLSLLSDQSVQLNQKLISSIGKSADLEDELHELQSAHKTLNTRAEELTKEKEKWEESMNTGLLVERSQIKDEMQKLAQGLVEEERRRGTAEEKRREVENEVDDLTAKLFDQANAMVATERMSRASAEARLKSTEENLAAAEAAVRDMQLHLQNAASTSSSSSSHPSAAHTSSQNSSDIKSITITRKYLSSHLPYSEFISFITHLRSLRPLKETSKNTFPPPLVTNLLTQPFLTRTVAEDNDPTLRLDVAPDLSWLSRRSVAQAIISGDLIIEPVSTSTLLSNSNSAMQDIGCSLCGRSIFPQHVPQSPGGSHFGPPPIHPQRGTSSTTSRFSLKPFFNSSSSSTATAGSSSTSATPQPSASPAPHAPSPSQSPAVSPAIGSSGSITSVYIFRIAKAQVQTGSTAEKGDSKLYPLCRTGWCLERMRATCELWHFVRTGIIHVVWHGDDGTATVSTTANTNTENNRLSGSSASASATSTSTSTTAQESATASAGASTASTTADQSTPTAPAVSSLEESKVPAQPSAPPPPLPQRKKSSWALGFKLSDKSTGSWTRGWKSGSGPASPGAGPERRESVGSLGAEKSDSNGNGGLGLGDALDIDEKKKSSIEIGGGDEGEREKAESEVPIIQEPPSDGKVGAIQEDAKQDKEQESEEEQRPGLSRAGSNISIPLSTNTDETGFHTPKGGQNDLPSDDGHDHDQANSEEDVIKRRDEQATPHPPPRIDTKSSEPEGGKDSTVELASSTSNSMTGNGGTDSPTKAAAATPPPIPRRAAARNRLSQLSAGGSGANSPIADSPANSQPPTPVNAKSGASGVDTEDGDVDELDILRELRDELDQRKSEDISRGFSDPEASGDAIGKSDNQDTEEQEDGVDNGNTTVEASNSETEMKDHGDQPQRQNGADADLKDVDDNKDKKDAGEEGNEVEEEEEPPFTPVNLDEKFPLSPLQQQAFPINRDRNSTSNSISDSSRFRPNSQPPVLPPRHPKTPTLQPNSHPDPSTNTNLVEKRYFTIRSKSSTNPEAAENQNQNHNQWEEKTWEKVVKLKEEMWKARIGVLDQERN
ncbi:uncharacterized protein I303_102036 [Kwoniella dejecticola CBS 10117]|uniref:GDP/GTP exchange factor Sec2 N-terminal domain-containing protein n=1 Tax=Kwoniella dejecticola CBS 10117 TaxID=1296121 RepID=A0A1A6AC27_9TREE|nr:uncharacterized protein I303_01825 [Kwoniella dejecticola CBS 10117]OBR87617.1 hypothetical protein I303_01825 [Kwoniella dejecticola CBS 10117]